MVSRSQKAYLRVIISVMGKPVSSPYNFRVSVVNAEKHFTFIVERRLSVTNFKYSLEVLK